MCAEQSLSGQVYLHSSLKNTAENTKWKREILTLLESNPSASHLMVELFYQNQNLLENFTRAPIGVRMIL